MALFSPNASVIIANVWHGMAFSMMNFQSALDNVSGDIEEAARVDGASRIQTLLYIIVPCIKDTIATNIMLNTLSTLGVYGLIYAMTGGGPGNKTMTLPIYMYNQGLKGMQLGFGTAIGMMILAVGAVCSIAYTILLKTAVKTRRQNMNNRRVKYLHYIVLTFMALTFVLPLIWLVIASFDPNASDSLKAPATWSLGNYISVLTDPDNLKAYWVGFVISFVESLIVVVLSCMAAYPLSRYKLSYKKVFMNLICL